MGWVDKVLDTMSPAQLEKLGAIVQPNLELMLSDSQLAALTWTVRDVWEWRLVEMLAPTPPAALIRLPASKRMQQRLASTEHFDRYCPEQLRHNLVALANGNPRGQVSRGWWHPTKLNLRHTVNFQPERLERVVNQSNRLFSKLEALGLPPVPLPPELQRLILGRGLRRLVIQAENQWGELRPGTLLAPLEDLHLGGQYVLSPGLQDSLARVPTLTKLELRLARVGDVSLARLSEAPALRSLVLESVRGARLHELLAVPEGWRLQDLTLSNLLVDDRVWPVIAKHCPRLRSLEVTFCTQVTGERLGCLYQCPKLTKIKIEQCSFHSRYLTQFLCVPWLERLSLKGLLTVSVAEVKETLAGHPSLKVLELPPVDVPVSHQGSRTLPMPPRTGAGGRRALQLDTFTDPTS